VPVFYWRLSAAKVTYATGFLVIGFAVFWQAVSSKTATFCGSVGL